MAWNPPLTFVAGAKHTAAELNAGVRDPLNAIGDTWATYTPTWTATGSNPSIGNGSIDGHYIQAGKLVIFRLSLTMGSTTGKGTGSYAFGLPVAVADPLDPVGQCFMLDNSTVTVALRLAYANSSDTVAAADQAGNRISNTVPFTWATNDRIIISGTYEAD